jgi:Amt family ammonium transporter
VTGIVATGIFTAVVTYLIFKVIDVMVGLRVEEEDETQGLDIISHNERGYDI